MSVARVVMVMWVLAGCAPRDVHPSAPQPLLARPETEPPVPVVPVEPAQPSEDAELRADEVPTRPRERVTESGIHIEILAEGAGGQHPTRQDRVRVHYVGQTEDGKVFDSSFRRGKPASFAVSGVIEGWQEVLPMMTVGDRWRVVIPAELAYGAVPKRAGAPAGDLTFEIELLEVIEEIVPPEAPSDVSGPPSSATVTPTGLAYRVLSKGGGTAHPTASDRVKVHYTGWTTAGKMFDSSVTRGRPAVIPLGGVIQGWTEVLQLMSPGDRFRAWIPAALAYGKNPTRPGVPAGMLVFDIELLEINP